MADDENGPQAPAFGPSGYLPERASRRARKIVLRAPLGLQWVVGALLVGALLVVAGVALLGGEDTPEPPFTVAAPDVGALGPVQGTTVGDVEVLLVAVGGRPRAFVAPAGPAPVWCEPSGLLERDGAAWRATGRGVRSEPSLLELPSRVVDGAVWVDPTAPLPAARPDPDGPALGC